MSWHHCKRVVLWAVLAGSVSSCTPLWHGVFINATQRRVEVSLVKPTDGQVVNRFSIEPRSSFKTEVGILNAIVTDENGARLSEGRLTFIDPQHRYSKLEERLVYFLVTEKGVYRIPREYRKDWQDHIDVIVTEASTR